MIRPIVLIEVIFSCCCVVNIAAASNIFEVPADLTVPAMTTDKPGPGKRVRQVIPEYRETQVHHALYLPTDWQPGRRYPVLVEYAGNGPFRSQFGDVSTGEVQGSNLGYGISAGKGFIWICMPYVNSKEKKNQLYWWGDKNATTAYCRKAVRSVCEEYGGDPSAVILAGFSRGALACSYLGLNDDETADIWLAFVPYSHFDGVNEKWGYAEADRASTAKRLSRLGGRAVFVCSESQPSLAATRQFLDSLALRAPITYQSTGFLNHNDAWTLRPCPARDALRKWVSNVLKTRPGTFSIQGRVTDRNGQPLADVRIESGFNHFTFTDAKGFYDLRGLVGGRHAVKAIFKNGVFKPMERQVTLTKNLCEQDFVMREKGDGRN